MIDSAYIIKVVAVMALVTFALRALPFLAAQWLKKHPVVQHLGQFLPLAIMTLLLLHSVVSAAKEHVNGPWPELLAVTVAALTQWQRRNPLLSIVAGTGIYVLMRNING